MGFFTGLAIGVIGTFVAKVIKDDCAEKERKRQEDARRRSIPCNFTEDLTVVDFEKIAKKVAKCYKGKLKVEVYNGHCVEGEVRTKSGGRWIFRLDFNDYGSVTGRSFITCNENKESSVPMNYARDMKDAIIEWRAK